MATLLPTLVILGHRVTGVELRPGGTRGLIRDDVEVVLTAPDFLLEAGQSAR
jgi:hypothetical protein